jgi:MFS family permease
VYTLLFADAGLSVWQISSLFVIWSVSSMVFEVPSGAWADATSRRRLLIVGPLLTAVSFALWVAHPSFWVFAALAEIGGHPGASTILMLPYVLVAVILTTSSWRRAASRRRMPQTEGR